MSAIKPGSVGSAAKKPKFTRNNFMSKNEILSWINDLLKVNMTLIEQLGSGTMYCQIFDVIYPGVIPLQKVKWNARLEYDFIHNFMLLQSGFDKMQIPKAIPVNKLSKTKYQDNLEFAQWLKAYFDFNCKEKGKGYNALKRRGNLTPYFGFCKGGVLPKQTLFFGNAKEKFQFDDNSSSSDHDQQDDSSYQSPQPCIPLSIPPTSIQSAMSPLQLPAAGIFSFKNTPSHIFQSPQQQLDQFQQCRQGTVFTPQKIYQQQQQMHQAQQQQSQQSQQFPQFFARQQQAEEKSQPVPQQQKVDFFSSSVTKTPLKPLLDGQNRLDAVNKKPESTHKEDTPVSKLFLSRLQSRMNSAIRTDVSIAKPIEEKKASLTTSNLLSKIQELTNASQILLKRTADTSVPSDSATKVASSYQLLTNEKKDRYLPSLTNSVRPMLPQISSLSHERSLKQEEESSSMNTMQKSSVKRQLKYFEKENNDEFQFETPLRKQIKCEMPLNDAHINNNNVSIKPVQLFAKSEQIDTKELSPKSPEQEVQQQPQGLEQQQQEPRSHQQQQYNLLSSDFSSQSSNDYSSDMLVSRIRDIINQQNMSSDSILAQIQTFMKPSFVQSQQPSQVAAAMHII